MIIEIINLYIFVKFAVIANDLVVLTIAVQFVSIWGAELRECALYSYF